MKDNKEKLLETLETKKKVRTFLLAAEKSCRESLEKKSNLPELVELLSEHVKDLEEVEREIETIERMLARDKLSGN